jgi:hypothetical protein
MILLTASASGHAMNEELFQIGAPDIDTGKIVDEIRAMVEDKTAQGLYPDEKIARAERHNLRHLQDHAAFVEYYMNCLRQATYVDISDFEIRERRRHLGPALVALKKGLWSLLRFYTYRLWSQQNQVNDLLVTGIEGVDRKQDERRRDLERRVTELEARLADRDA